MRRNPERNDTDQAMKPDILGQGILS